MDLSEIKKNLEKAAKAQQRLYHYTTLAALLEMVNSGCLRFSNVAYLNDKKEEDFSHGRHLYIMSFTGENEYTSMWSIYGEEKEIKIRMDFPVRDFLSCFDKRNVYNREENYNWKTRQKEENWISSFCNTKKLIDIPTNPLCELCYVMYMNKEETQLCVNVPKHIEIEASEENRTKLAGFYKYDLWEYEHEIRAVINASSADVSSVIKKTSEDGALQFAYPRYLYLRMTDGFFKDVNVTFNPWMSELMQQELAEILNKKGITCRPSEFDSQIGKLSR